MDIYDTAIRNIRGTLHIVWDLATIHNVIHSDAQWKPLNYKCFVSLKVEITHSYNFIEVDFIFLSN